MTLAHRPTTLQDLDACLPLLCNGFTFDPDDRAALLPLWRHLISGDMAESAVIEDRDRPDGQRIVGFGLSVFVTDEFVAEAGTGLLPYLTRHVLRRWQQSRPPFLNAAQIRRANSSDSLNGLILHNGWAAGGRADQETPVVRQKIVEAFFAHHSGYRLRCFLHEIYGATERDRLAGAGWRLETDCATFSPTGPPEEVPFLMGLQREDVLKDPFSPFFRLFGSPAPRLFFRPAEQALLRRALRGKNDAEIAEALGISLFTVHKRWRTAFETVTRRAPLLLPEGKSAGRGPEKRSHLLRYLQDHPEELRPVNRPSDGRG